MSHHISASLLILSSLICIGLAANRTYTVTSIESYPFLTVREGSHSGNERYTGFIPDLLKKLSRIVGIDYKLQLVKDGKYGSQQSDGRWNGMIGELTRREADVAAAPLTITSRRERVVDFTKPFMSAGIAPYIKPLEQPKINKLLLIIKPFTLGVWGLMDCVAITVVVGLFLINRYNPYECAAAARRGEIPAEQQHAFSFINILWFAFSTYTWQGYTHTPRSLGGKVLAVAWFIFIALILITYTVALIPFLPKSIGGSTRYTLPVSDLESAIEKNYDFYALDQGSTYQFFRVSTINVYERIYSKIKTVNSLEEGLQKAVEGDIFMAETPFMDAMLNREPCHKLVRLGGNLDAKGYGLATHLESELRDVLSLAVLQLRETGELQRLHKKWWYDRSECGKIEAHASHGKPEDAGQQGVSLDISWTGGIFIYFFIGAILSAVVTVVEIIFFRRKHAKASDEKAEQTLQPKTGESEDQA